MNETAARPQVARRPSAPCSRLRRYADQRAACDLSCIQNPTQISTTVATSAVTPSVTSRVAPLIVTT